MKAVSLLKNTFDTSGGNSMSQVCSPLLSVGVHLRFCCPKFSGM